MVDELAANQKYLPFSRGVYWPDDGNGSMGGHRKAARFLSFNRFLSYVGLAFSVGKGRKFKMNWVRNHPRTMMYVCGILTLDSILHFTPWK